MTIKELRARLAELPQELEVEVVIGHNAYPADAVYVAPWNREHTVSIGCTKEH